jgi:hypothetical protein
VRVGRKKRKLVGRERGGEKRKRSKNNKQHLFDVITVVPVYGYCT